MPEPRAPHDSEQLQLKDDPTEQVERREEWVAFARGVKNDEFDF